MRIEITWTPDSFLSFGPCVPRFFSYVAVSEFLFLFILTQTLEKKEEEVTSEEDEEKEEE